MQLVVTIPDSHKWKNEASTELSENAVTVNTEEKFKRDTRLLSL